MLPVINCDVGAYFAFMSFPGHLLYLFSYLQMWDKNIAKHAGVDHQQFFQIQFCW